jgi:hypothetical protein
MTDMTTPPNLSPGTDVRADPEHLEQGDAVLTTDADQKQDDLDVNEGEEGSA